MARAIIEVPVTNGVPQLPPMSSDSEPCLHEMVNGKVRSGSGYSCVGPVPPDAKRVLMLIDSSEATLAAMVKSGSYPYFAAVQSTAKDWPACKASQAESLTACKVTQAQYEKAETQGKAMASAVTQKEREVL